MNPGLILVATIALALILIAVGVWRLIASWGKQKAKADTAGDDLMEAQKAAELAAKATEVKREAPTTPAGLGKWLRSRVRGADSR